MSMSDLTLTLNLGNVAYFLIVFSAFLPSLAKYFYMSYRLIFGTLYPTYLSFKALKQKDDQECVRMIMYWTVYGIFTFLETFLDIFVGLWFPFYFESKIVFLFWLISPYGNGAKILYENFVHKKIEQNEEVIDDFISKAKIISVDLFWKLYDSASVHARYFLIKFFAKLQIAFIQYMDNRNDLNRIQNPFLASFGSNLGSGSLKQIEQLPVQQPGPIVAEIQNEANDPNHGDEALVPNDAKADSLIYTEDEEAVEVKKPGRKAKRVKRRDISNNASSTVRMTRSKTLKSESHSSDIEMS